MATMDITGIMATTTAIMGVTDIGDITDTGDTITDMAMDTATTGIVIMAVFALPEPTSATKAGIAIRTVIEDQAGSLLET
jgi:hypothetical protein